MITLLTHDDHATFSNMI